MVKNKKGGSQHKKMASKNAKEQHNVRKTLRFANPREPCEMYARVTNIYGGQNVGVICNDGVERLCVMRRKFRGRNKRDNQISFNNIILVGKREWEVVAPSKKQKVDLLYIYSNYQYEQLKGDKSITDHIWKEIDEEIKEEENVGVEFTTEEDVLNDTNIVINMKQGDSKKTGDGNKNKNKNITKAEVIDWDDI
jgi:translation initiation factor IF-1